VAEVSRENPRDSYEKLDSGVKYSLKYQTVLLLIEEGPLGECQRYWNLEILVTVCTVHGDHTKTKPP
jgi:hypothetical protein